MPSIYSAFAPSTAERHELQLLNEIQLRSNGKQKINLQIY